MGMEKWEQWEKSACHSNKQMPGMEEHWQLAVVCPAGTSDGVHFLHSCLQPLAGDMARAMLSVHLYSPKSIVTKALW